MPAIRRTLLVAATFLLLCPHGAAEEDAAAPEALPFEAFGPRTFFVVRIRLEGLTADRAEQALRAVLPAKFPADTAQETIDGARGVLAQVEAVVTRPLVATGIRHVFVLLDAPASGPLDDAVPRLAIPVRGTRAREQIEAVRAFASKTPLTVRVVPGCVVLHEGAPPESAFVTIDEAPFQEAYAALPDHDVVIVMVPQEPLRASARSEYRAMLEAEPRSEGDAVIAAAARDLAPVVEADWFGVSVRLGTEPVLHLSARLASEEAVGRVRRGMDRICDFLQEQWKRDSVSEEGDRIYDPELGVRMVEAVRLDADLMPSALYIVRWGAWRKRPRA